ncbi:MAG: hypothetical protein JXA79_00365, partial [Deltaproteobacteria bacterium]|nr:hypothetical protein [Deltaproteobacteria bacterium]
SPPLTWVSLLFSPSPLSPPAGGKGAVDYSKGSVDIASPDLQGGRVLCPLILGKNLNYDITFHLSAT